MSDEHPAISVDDSFWRREAALVVLVGPVPTRAMADFQGGIIKQGKLADMVALVMEAHPADRWRYSIVTDDDPWMTATDIEAVAFRDDFPFANFLNVGRK